jgi:hypothetical protein
MVTGRINFASGVNTGRRTSSTGFGIVPRDQRGQQVLADDDKRRERDDNVATERASWMSLTRPISTPAADNAAAQQQTNGMKSCSGSSRYGAETVAPAAPFRHQAQREPHERTEGRLARCRRRRWRTRAEIRRVGSPFDQPLSKAAQPAQATLESGHLAVIALVIIAEQVEQAV